MIEGRAGVRGIPVRLSILGPTRSVEAKGRSAPMMGRGRADDEPRVGRGWVECRFRGVRCNDGAQGWACAVNIMGCAGIDREGRAGSRG